MKRDILKQEILLEIIKIKNFSKDGKGVINLYDDEFYNTLTEEDINVVINSIGIDGIEYDEEVEYEDGVKTTFRNIIIEI